MAKIVDKLSNNDVHFRSLICSLAIGQTKFDDISDKKEADRAKSRLVREVYRVFEMAVKLQYEKIRNAPFTDELQ